ncbi:PWWP domain-containing DNA repair factor 3A [Mauremys reevesii]|uniref:PWWP domain-containing DNA repair factor 3A n=1 Tax=Mauremys reevesii TaxID=260615 RepID=UPI00193EF956|nr:PWWP domain-containing DNA repair factor 3A [Mauremys reevesii]XP_039371649.1 PWWP domain-containing DNA repair factor 3A [Mauremys reevesii]XP_039371650.1 PWWP domain-containing DNA repair factor 3A [Mauremys reevesii]XP_039371651.1 PWWP domain-containing DNA repair factor 3A [Mauremys reevesii]XP_039371652.1 PWWP domain-containing DNA repair factor 3A [Mauremys reevesii]XP_039371653.1 PWWP domain-containing DNA repair factor 3A [Mauremys reevesii]XP_039371654.1 PWWP domain-containing DNA
MTDQEYILCKWKNRLWPAKVLCKNRTSRRPVVSKAKEASFKVEILGLEEQTNVNCVDTEPLEEERIKIIASELDQRNKPSHPVEELKYRKALKIALDILSASPKQVRPSDEGQTTRSGQKENKIRTSLSPPVTRYPISSPKIKLEEGETLKKKRKQKTPSPQTDTEKNKRKYLLSSKETAKTRGNRTNSSVSKSGDFSSTWKSESQHYKTSKSKVKTLTQQKTVKSKLLPKSKTGKSSSLLLKENEKSKKGRKRPRDADEPSSPSTKFPDDTAHVFVRESTPVSASCNSAMLISAGKRPNVRGLPKKKLLDFSITSTSPELESNINEERDTPARKYKMLDVSKKPVNSKCVSWKQKTTAVPPLHKKGGCINGPEPLSGASKHNNYSESPLSEFKKEENKGTPHSPVNKAKNCQLPDFDEDEAGLDSSDLSLKFSSPEGISPDTTLVDEEEEEEDEELPSILLCQEPCSIEPGMLVWCKLPRYPYWPAVIKRVTRKYKKANVRLIEAGMNDKKAKGFSIGLKNLKHFDCKEKQNLIDKAKEDYSQEIEWCIELIADYRIRVGCRSFTGSFLEYCADDISYPVRKEVNQGKIQMTFPVIAEEDFEESLSETTPIKPSKKVLPDRMRAARDKANSKIVDFIVKTKGAEAHLLAILKSKKQSRWLREFLNSSQYMTCETYLEDEEQLDLVVNYLQEVCHEIDTRKLDVKNGDRIKFILDVLLPEAIIYAISAVDDIDYKKAEEKYIKGPCVSKREREIFDKEILEKKKLELLKTDLPPEDSV